MNQFWLIWQKLTKSTDWLRDGQGKATNGSGKNCFHLGCIQKITFRVAQNARNSQKWRWAIEHYNIINRASLVGDEENRKMYPPIAVAITRISECWEPPLLPPGLLPSGVPLCPSPLPSIWNILTPSLTLTFLWHFSSTPPFTWLLKSLPLGDKHFWNLWLQSRAFHTFTSVTDCCQCRKTNEATKPTGRRERRRATGFQRLRPASQSLTSSPNVILFSI